MRSPLLLSLPLAGLLMAGAPPPASPKPPTDDLSLPQPLSAGLPPGAARDALARILLKPYADATGTQLAQPTWDGGTDALRKLIDSHSVDLVLLSGVQLAELCRGGALQKLDWTALGGRDRLLAGASGDCGAGAYVSATVLVWDRDKLAGTPGWADFWDVAKHPGRRGLRRGARGNLEIALLADGVAAGDIYRTLRSADGVDRAFRKLDQLKPYVVWWDQPAQPGQMLATAKVLLTSSPAFAQARPAQPKSHVGTQWAGSLAEISSWAIPAGAPHQAAAAAALSVATDAARLVALARATGLGPTTKQGVALLPADLRADNPSLPANQQASLAVDEAFWAESGDKLEARFATWVGK